MLNKQAKTMQKLSDDYDYHVITVEKTTAPEGMVGDNWFRYVIRKDNSVLECKKSGTLKTVTEHANNAAELINSRNISGCNAYSSRKKK